MKIAFLSIYSGKIDRGVEVFVQELASQIASNNEVVIFSSKNIFENDFVYRTSTLKELLFGKEGVRILKFTLEIIQKLDKFDLIIPVNGGWESVLVKIYSMLKNKRVIIPGQFGLTPRELLNLLCRPDYYIALSLTHKKWAARFFSEDKIITIPNGVNTSVFDSSKQNKKPPFTIICVAALEKNKRIDLTIKAVSRLENVNLLVLGNGSLKVELLELGNKLLKNRFNVLSVSYSEMVKHYHNSKVMTLASWHEGMPLSILEAMSCNLPVVTAPDHSRKEIIGNGGILVNTKDISDYASALKLAISKDWGLLPRHQAEKFSWKKIGIQYMEVIKKL